MKVFTDPISTAMTRAISDAIELSASFCRQRQQKFLDRLTPRGINAALILNRRHIHYFTGFWARSVFAPALLLRHEQAALLALPFPAVCTAAEVISYKANHLGTMIDSGVSKAVEMLLTFVPGRDLVGSDRVTTHKRVLPINDDLSAMRRSKWPDELAFLRRGIEAAEAGYAYAAAIIRPGVNEIQLYSGLLATITNAAGEPIGELGNDFQSGSLGGSPRNRVMQQGESLPLDLGVCVRGYTADLCRTFVVGNEPSQQQMLAHARVSEVLLEIENLCKPGASCRELYEVSKHRLHGFKGFSFEHHLGHGTGLSPHEAPRLNPEWEDVLQPGDVFTVEPGLYDQALRAGIRIEQMFYVTEVGVERLSHFSTELVHG